MRGEHWESRIKQEHTESWRQTLLRDIQIATQKKMNYEVEDDPKFEGETTETIVKALQDGAVDHPSILTDAGVLRALTAQEQGLDEDARQMQAGESVDGSLMRRRNYVYDYLIGPILETAREVQETGGALDTAKLRAKYDKLEADRLAQERARVAEKEKKKAPPVAGGSKLGQDLEDKLAELEDLANQGKS